METKGKLLLIEGLFYFLIVGLSLIMKSLAVLTSLLPITNFYVTLYKIITEGEIPQLMVPWL